MLGLLVELDDRGSIETFLTVVVAGGFAKADGGALMAALGRLDPARRAALIEHLVAGTAVGSLGACADLLARAASAWAAEGACDLTGAARRLLEALPPGPARATPQPAWKAGGPGVDADIVTDLLAGLCVIDLALAERATGHVLAAPKVYGMDAVLVPAARRLGRAEAAQGTTALAMLRTACLAHLHRRIAEPLAAPTDWRRDAALTCRCPRCAGLARFLADSETRTWVLKAPEAERAHVAHSIRQAGSDVDMTTDRTGRPYRLVCTKNQASYERRTRQRRRDVKDAAELAE